MDDLQLLQGDCIEVMGTFSGGSVDVIIADLPYGLTQAKWDSEIDLDDLWRCYKHVAKPTTPFILFASQPFTSKLIASNLRWFKYCWYWKKEKGNGFLNAKRQPLRSVEEICVFYQKQCPYYPQMIPLDQPKVEYLSTVTSEQFGTVKTHSTKPVKKVHHAHYPTTLLEFNRDKKNRIHSTQKPLALIEYLVKTYSKEGDVILDNVMGSGTTGVACKNLGRSFVGIELDAEMFELAKDRIAE
jgi:site-specific DNA-methyltransferase (adenine-specific)